MKDASAAIQLPNGDLLVAGDEVNAIEIYRNVLPLSPSIDHLPTPKYSSTFTFGQYLPGKKNGEADVEAAAMLDGVSYWIGSHGRNAKGKLKKKRYYLFALVANTKKDRLDLQWCGAYRFLLHDLLDADNWQDPAAAKSKTVRKAMGRAAQLDKKILSRLAPKLNGVNIEALAANYDNQSLFVGFRNPLAAGKAIIVELLNPAAMMSKQKTKAQFGRAFMLDLHGLGLRAMANRTVMHDYILLVGPSKGGGPFKLFSWHPGDGDTAVFLKDIPIEQGSHPEAMICFNNNVQIFYDEGAKTTDKVVKNKYTKPVVRASWHQL